VDGNVLRVLTRILADKRDIALPATKKELTELLRSEYPEGEEASLLTEGIMEIGERVCIPNGVPLCSSCPLFDICLARKKGLTDQIPVKSPKAERKLVKMTVFILEHDGKFALRKRSNEGLLSGMWEFYHTEKNLSQKEALAHLKESGFCPTEIRSLGNEHHIFTHLEWKMKGYFAHVENRGNLIWKTKEELEQEIALPGAFHKWKQKMKEGML
jgi:A/G-specific adenine glycosylase